MRVVGGIASFTECVLSGNGISTGNQRSRLGGALFDYFAAVTMDRCAVLFNAADLGAGLYNRFTEPESMTVPNSTLAFNTGTLITSRGTALDNPSDAVDCTVVNCTITGNSGMVDGAGAVDGIAAVRMRNSVVAANL